PSLPLEISEKDRLPVPIAILLFAKLLLICPPQQGRAGGETGADGGKQHQIALLEAALLASRVQRQRDGSRGGVAVLVNIDDDTFFLQSQAVSGGHNDSAIGLMRREQRYIGSFETVALQDRNRSLRHFSDSVLED